jgi:hypothetical protein
MNELYIRHKNLKDRMLVCDTQYRLLHEVSSVPHKLRDKAFYTHCSVGYVGVYSSPQGPILFINDRQFPFTDAAWNITVQRKKAVNQVTFTGINEGPLTFDHPLVEPDPLDPWSEVAFDDFFNWLATKRTDLELIGMWTGADQR